MITTLEMFYELETQGTKGVYSSPQLLVYVDTVTKPLIYMNSVNSTSISYTQPVDGERGDARRILEVRDIRKVREGSWAYHSCQSMRDVREIESGEE